MLAEFWWMGSFWQIGCSICCFLEALHSVTAMDLAALLLSAWSGCHASFNWIAAAFLLSIKLLRHKCATMSWRFCWKQILRTTLGLGITFISASDGTAAACKMFPAYDAISVSLCKSCTKSVYCLSVTTCIMATECFNNQGARGTKQHSACHTNLACYSRLLQCSEGSNACTWTTLFYKLQSLLSQYSNMCCWRTQAFATKFIVTLKHAIPSFGPNKRSRLPSQKCFQM